LDKNNRVGEKMAQRMPLPIDSELRRIVRQLAEARSLVLIAEPGAGKTTRLPPAILRERILPAENPNLVILQPRRVAARAAAQRIAEENSWRIGEEVGYHIRFEKRLGPQTRLRVLTEGILTRQLLADPFLPGIGAVILDEFHERSIHTDLALAMLREIRATVRPDLMIVVMSATLDAQPVAKFLGDCPTISIQGRTFPVEIEYRPHAGAHLVERIVAAVSEEIDRAPLFPFPGTPGEGHGGGLSEKGGNTGDLLVFLPGAEEIRRAARDLEEFGNQHNLAILPLHGSLPADEQTAALAPSQKRKVILSTNIAETSLTIDGVTRVIDSGFARVPMFDPRRGLDRLELKRISRASAAQRAGRAGRTQPGCCIRLWSAKEQADLEDHELPEIQRVELCATVLDVYAWGKSDPDDFGWFEAPPESHLNSAKNLLEMLGALEDGKITPMGQKLKKMPVHPRLGRLLIAAAEAGCVEEGAAMAAILSERDFLRRQPPGERATTSQDDSDLLLRLGELDHPRMETDPMARRQILRTRDELLRIARRLENARHVPADETLMKLPLLAYPDRVCRRRETDPSAAAMVGGGGVRLAPESIVRKSEFFLALDARSDPRNPKSEAAVAIASAVEPQWLTELFPHSIQRERTTIYDESRQRVVGINRLWYRDLILSEDQNAAVDADDASKTLAAALRPMAQKIFEEDESSSSFLARLEFLRRWMPEHSWPQIDFAAALEETCRGKKGLEEVRRAPLASALESQLGYPLGRLLAQHAPETMDVPSGSRIRLDYSTGQSVLAVRLQEIFGWTETPRLASGRAPVLLHLLGPNFRPVQITDDLKSFWSTTYFQVRKDLRAQYPKHSWPVDPLTAKPVAKGRPRKN
jgi:ATP-dependent helicase HrpB